MSKNSNVKITLFPQRGFDEVDKFFYRRGVDVENCGTFAIFSSYGLALYQFTPQYSALAFVMVLLGCLLISMKQKKIEVRTAYNCNEDFVQAVKYAELNKKNK